MSEAILFPSDVLITEKQEPKFPTYGSLLTTVDGRPLSPAQTIVEAYQSRTGSELPKELEPFANIMIPEGMFRTTNNMLFYLFITPQLLGNPEHPGMTPLYAAQSRRLLLKEFERRFKSLLPEDKQDLQARIKFSTALLSLDGQQNPETSFPVADYLVFEIRNAQNEIVFTQTGGIGSYPFRDADFYSLKKGTKIDPWNLDDFGKTNALLHDTTLKSCSPTGIFDDPIIMIACPENATLCATSQTHPVLGTKYELQGASKSLTDAYFERMGYQTSFWAPPGAVAPYRVLHRRGVDLNNEPPERLAAVVAMMTIFQEVLWPKIYLSQKPLDNIYTVDPKAPYNEPFLSGTPYNILLRNLVLGSDQARWAQQFLEINRAPIEIYLQNACYQQMARELIGKGCRGHS
ncbi:MAG: putative oxygenase MesX [Holosporales bacterium]